MVIKTVQHNICLRECAKIMKIAEKYHCKIRILSNGLSGDTDSILSLAHLRMKKGDTVLVSIYGTYFKGLVLNKLCKLLEGDEDS